MQKSNDKIKKLAGDVLSQFEASPPDDMWDRIDRQMKRRKRILLFWNLALAATVLILISVGISLLLPGAFRSFDQNQHSENIKKKAQRFIESIDTASYENTVKKPSGVYDTVQGIIYQDNAGKSKSASTEKAFGLYAENEASNLRNNPLVINPGNLSDSVLVANRSSIVAPVLTENLSSDSISLPVSPLQVVEIAILQKPGNQDTIVTGVIMPLNNEIVPARDKSGKNNWQLAMGYGTSSTSKISESDGAMRAQNSSFTHNSISTDIANGTFYFEEIEKIGYESPLSIGFLISRQIGRRWFVESGLLYSRLGYKLKTYELNSKYYEYRHEIYYLGIPVGIRFKLLERRHFGLYASQAVITEKGISMIGTTDTYSKGKLSGTENEIEKIPGIQMSSLTGVGADIKLYGKFSFYAQGGLQLFFLNKTQPFNIRSARIAWPSLQAGIRMNIN